MRGTYLLLIGILTMIRPFDTYAQQPSDVAARCRTEDDSGFKPRAITLTPINVREAVPKYSLLRGRWEIGKRTDVLSKDTCVEVLKKRMIGVIQIWYYVRYRSPENRELLEGWIWGGTKDRDDKNYIGGNLNPTANSENTEGAGYGASLVTSLTRTVHAQGDRIPSKTDSEDRFAGPGELSGNASNLALVQLPLFGAVRLETWSGVLFFLAMVAGMLAKALWDHYGTEESGWFPPAKKVIRPILVSPITYSAFLGALYVQQQVVAFSLTSAFYAFQGGFMWQHVLEKKTGSTGT